MTEYNCKRPFYIEDVVFASTGDVIVLLPDNTTVVNISAKPQKVAHNSKFIVERTDYFEPIKKKDPKPAADMVNHPSHYTWLKDKCNIEVIDITRHLDFDTGNAVKYLLRAGHKSEEGMTDKEKTIQDLKKATWYINDRIKQLENG